MPRMAAEQRRREAWPGPGTRRRGRRPTAQHSRPVAGDQLDRWPGSIRWRCSTGGRWPVAVAGLDTVAGAGGARHRCPDALDAPTPIVVPCNCCTLQVSPDRCRWGLTLPLPPAHAPWGVPTPPLPLQIPVFFDFFAGGCGLRAGSSRVW